MAKIVKGDDTDNLFDLSLLDEGAIVYLYGGDDTVIGTRFNDTIEGGDGDDVFIVNGSGQGLDKFIGGAGSDQIVGTVVDDVVGLSAFSAVNSVEAIDGGAGFNLIQGDGANNTLNFAATTLLNIARIEGLAGNDTITGSAGSDVIVGGIGNDRLYGGPGDDVFVVEGNDQGVDTIAGDAGYDRIIGGTGDDVIQLGSFTGSSTVEEIDGGAGLNLIQGDGANNTLNFAATTLLNIARIEGLAGNDTITGSAGSDVIVGGIGNDRLYGGPGDDVFVVEGNDQGVDTIAGDAGYDQIIGGTGDDVIQLGSFTGSSTVEEIDGGAGLNLIQGDGANNTLNFAATTLLNIARIEGLAGNDTITGSATADVIVGGGGNDILDGGNGDDMAVFSGLRSGYSVSIGPTSVIVTDIDAADGNDGVDTLKNIERLLFSDTEVRLFAPNNAPVAQADYFSIQEDESRIFLKTDLLANDSDGDGDSLTITKVFSPSNGSVTLDAYGNVRFTPLTNFNGNASFQYEISDGQKGFSSTTVNISVAPVNDAPQAGNDVVVTPIDTPILIPWSQLLSNDKDVDGDALSISSVFNPVRGIVELDESGVLFTPEIGNTHNGGFEYTIDDGHGGVATGVVSVRMDTGLPEFRVVATAIGGQTVFQWDGLTGEYLGALVPRGTLINPQAVAIGPDGNLYVAYGGNYYQEPSVHRYSTDGTHLGEYASLAGLSAYSVDWLTAIEFDREGYMYVLDKGSQYGQAEVFRFQQLGATDEGAYLETFLTPATICRPERRLISFDMELGPDGNLYFPSIASHDILKFKTPSGDDFGRYGEIVIGSGTVSSTNPLDYANTKPNNNGWSFDNYFGVRPFGMDWDENNHLFVVADMLESDFNTLRIIELDESGNYLRDLVSLADGYASAKTQSPFGDADFGPDGNFYVTSQYSSEILVYGDPSGLDAGELIAKLATPTYFVGIESISFIVDSGTWIGT